MVLVKSGDDLFELGIFVTDRVAESVDAGAGQVPGGGLLGAAASIAVDAGDDVARAS
jgi:hypothetical protein